MSTRTTPRRAARGRGLLRAATVGLAVLASVGLAVPSASAAPAVTITLDSAERQLHLRALENRGPVDVLSPWDGDGPQGPVAVGYGGSVTLDLPDLVDVAPTQAVLYLYPAQTVPAPSTPDPTRVYDSASAVPADQIPLTDLGSGQYRIDLPADDGVNGPIGLLFVKTLESTGGLVTGYAGGGRDLFGYWLELSAGGPAAVTLAPQLVLSSREDAVSLRGGDTVDVALPADSSLAAQGFSSLTAGSFTLHAVDGDGLPTGAPGIQLTPVVSPDGRTASLTLPAGTASGEYELAVVLGAGTDAVLSRTLVRVTVGAPLNPGLRSNTGWDQTDAGISPLVGIGAGMVLAAGLVTVVVLRPKRRAE